MELCQRGAGQAGFSPLILVPLSIQAAHEDPIPQNALSKPEHLGGCLTY